MSRKRPPSNLARCCVGACNDPTALIYLRHYPVCGSHWDKDCDNKFKYKHFRSLRDYLGLPPLEKPHGYEHLGEDYFAHKMDIAIDVQQNVPVIVRESLILWNPTGKTEHPKNRTVNWNGIKKDPIELFTELNDKKIVLLYATGKAVKFSSEKAINHAMEKLQETINGAKPENWEIRISKEFKKSKFWKIGDINGQV